MSETTETTLRTPLSAGLHGSKAKPGLIIRQYWEPRETKNAGEFMYTFVVSGNDSEPGTALLKFNLPPNSTHPGVLALAMPAYYLNHQDLTTADQIEQGKSLIQAEAAKKVLEANTPANEESAALALQYKNILRQISISVGKFIYRLQDWNGQSRDANAAFDDLSYTEFSGIVKHETYNGRINAIVSEVLPCNK